MTGAPQGACFGRAPPSLRSPPVRSERLINLDGLTENSGHNFQGRWPSPGSAYDRAKIHGECAIDALAAGTGFGVHAGLSLGHGLVLGCLGMLQAATEGLQVMTWLHGGVPLSVRLPAPIPIP